MLVVEVVPFAVEMTGSLTPMKPFIHQDREWYSLLSVQGLLFFAWRVWV